MRQRTVRQPQLFDEEGKGSSLILPEDIQREVTLLLVQWMQCVIRMNGKEVRDEQDRG